MAGRNQNLSLRGLRTFCVAAEQESFRSAADKLFITASAVSHQIKNLEEQLGQQLFDRSGRSLSLTDVGRSLLGELRPVIDQLDDVAARYRVSSTRRTLNISVQPFFASELFIPRLPRFTAEYPEIDIKVDTNDESAEKHPSSADASIRIFKSSPGGLESERLFSLRLLPAASPALRETLRIDDQSIAGELSLIIHDTRPGAWRQWQQSSGVELPESSKVIRLDSMIAVARAAERGLGAALVPVHLSDSWFESGSLVALSRHELITEDAYYFAYRKNDEALDVIGKLQNWVLQNFGNCR
jgi:DNA-binding transcriptional LysR family regulator